MSCGCRPKCEITKKSKDLGPCNKVDLNLLDQLKTKAICEFEKLLCQIEKGHNISYEFILQQISLIGLIEDNLLSLEDSRFYLNFYLNNEFVIQNN